MTIKFKFSAKSKEKLVGVHSDLVLVAETALTYSEIDFSVLEGVRTLATQKKYFASGASHTMESRHLTGHAIDVGAYVGNTVRWDLGLYYEIAESCRSASLLHKIPIRWGACWERIDDPHVPLQYLVATYVQRATAKGLRQLIDGPHFELPKGFYP